MELFDRKSIQKERISFAISELTEAGFDIHYEDATEIRFMLNGNEIRFWPYKGWFQGKGVQPGRGLQRLIKQLKRI